MKKSCFGALLNWNVLAAAGVIGMMTFLSASVRAEEALVEQSTSTFSTVYKNLRENIGLSADTRIYGPSVSDPTNPLTPNIRTGVPQYPISSENKVNLSYRIDPQSTVGASIWGNYVPVLDQKFTWMDPSVFFRRSRLVQYGNYRMDGTVRVFAGIGQLSRTYDEIVPVRLEQSSNYDLQGTRFSVGAYTYAQKNFLKSNPNKGAWDYQFLAIPSVSYRLSRTFSLELNYKMWAHHVNNRRVFDFENEKTLLGTGFWWTALPGLSINPYLDFSTGTKVTWDTTTLGMFMSYRAL